MKGTIRLLAVLIVFAAAACGAGSANAFTIGTPVNVTQDQLSQNETPLAVNPANPQMLLSGSNDWNYNDGCGMYVSMNGGQSWTGALPEGYLPGITKYTNDPNVAGTGAYDAGRRSGRRVQSRWHNGILRLPVVQLHAAVPDPAAPEPRNGHEHRDHLAADGADPDLDLERERQNEGWERPVPGSRVHPCRGLRPNLRRLGAVQRSGHALACTPVATSNDGGRPFSAPVKLTVGNIRNNQDQRIVTAPNGDAYLTFDNGPPGWQGRPFSTCRSRRTAAATWSTPIQFAALVDPVCIFPTTCFNISGGQFRAGGTYPAPAFDRAPNRLVVAYADIAGPYGQMYMHLGSGAPTSPVGPLRWRSPRRRPISSWASSESLQTGATTFPTTTASTRANQLVDLTYATSSDGGATLESRGGSSSAFDPSTWGVPSSSALGYRPFIGDYNGIVSRNDWAGMTWTGVAAPQPYNLEIYFAKVTP